MMDNDDELEDDKEISTKEEKLLEKEIKKHRMKASPFRMKRQTRQTYLKNVIDRNMRSVMPHNIKQHLSLDTFQGTMRKTTLNTMGTFAQ